MRVNFQSAFGSVFHAALGAAGALEARSKYKEAVGIQKQQAEAQMKQADAAVKTAEATAVKSNAEAAKTQAEAKLITEQARTTKYERLAKQRADKKALEAISTRYDEINATKNARNHMEANMHG